MEEATITWSQTVKSEWYKNQEMLLEFNRIAGPYLFDAFKKTGVKDIRHLDVGFSKEFLFLRKILSIIPAEHIFYFDKREGARNVLKKHKDLEHIAFTTTPEKEVEEGRLFTSVSCVYALHDCFGEKRKRGQEEERPIHTLQHLYPLLAPGALVVVIDYDLPWTNSWPNPMGVLQVVMNAREEKKIITPPPQIRKPTPAEKDRMKSITVVDHSEDVPELVTYMDLLRQDASDSGEKYEKNWVEAHNRYGRDKFLIDAKKAKFQQEIAISLPKEHPEYPKFFMYIGTKSKN